MPIQKIEQTGGPAGAGALVGGSLGSGLGGLLEGIAEGKLKRMYAQEQEQNLKKAFPELPDEALQFLSSRPPKEQLAYLQALGQAKRNEEQEFNLEQVTPEQKEQIREYLSKPEAIAAHTQEEIAKLQKYLNPPQEQLPIKREPYFGVKPLKETTIPGMNNLMQAGAGEAKEPTQAAATQSFPQLGHGTTGRPGPIEAPSKGLKLSQLGSPQGITAQHRAERLAFEREKENRIAQQSTMKQTNPYVEHIFDLEKAKTEEDNVLKRIIKISESEANDVRNPVLSSVMDQIGIDYAGLKNGSTLELEKLRNWFLRGGTKLFGGKVSNAEMFTLLSSVPSALQTKEGRTRLAKQMIIANKDFHDETKITKQIMKQNNGYAPLNIRYLVEDEMEPLRAENSRKFINGIYDEEKQAFKAGQKISANQLKELPEGAKYKRGGKKYIIQGGKEVERKGE